MEGGSPVRDYFAKLEAIDQLLDSLIIVKDFHARSGHMDVMSSDRIRIIIPGTKA